MYTCLLLALAGLTPSAQGSDAPSWSTDYYQTRQQGMTERKPLVVVVGSGQEGWNKLSRSGSLNKECKEVLASKYLCVYVDSQTEAGKKLAQRLDVGKLGIVISDASGKVMAFYHEGDLTDASLKTYLDRYSDPARTVAYTESNPGRTATTTTSYYPPVYQQQPSYIPSFRGMAGCST